MKTWMSMVAAALAVALAAACADDAADMAADGGPVDARVDAAADEIDAAAAPDAGVDDAAPIDARVADAAANLDADAPDSGVTCGTCIASSPCLEVACVAGTCQESPIADGTDCDSDSSSVCVAGICAPRVCGDGYREPGPEPAREGCDDGNVDDGDACSSSCAPVVEVVAAKAGGIDLPGPTPGRAAAADDAGHVLVVWHSRQAPRSYAVMARRYSRAGIPLDAAFVVAAGYADGASLVPTVVGLSSGWAVAWTAHGVTGDSDGTGIALVRIGVDGAAGTPFAANLTTFADQRDPALARVPGSGVVVVWTDSLGQAAYTRVLARRFSETLALPGPELIIGGGDAVDHFAPAVAGSDAGFAVAWTRRVLGASSEIWLRRFAPTGETLDTEPLVASEHDSEGQPLDGSDAAVVGLRDGSFAVAWTTYQDDVRGDVRGRIVPVEVDSLLAPSFVVLAQPGVVERRPSLAADGDGFVALVRSGTGLSDLLRDLVIVYLGATPPVELGALNQRLATSARQVDGSLAVAPGLLWVIWGEDPFVSTQSPATLAFLLPSIEAAP